MKRFLLAALLVPTLAAGWLHAQAATTKTLDIYVPDTEGGKIALFVTPAGQIVLVDTGSPGGRDVGRLMEVIAVAGIKKIDYLVSTHYHVDHVGGLQELAAKIPADTFVDHGPTVSQLPQERSAIAAVARQRHRIARLTGSRFLRRPTGLLPSRTAEMGSARRM